MARYILVEGNFIQSPAQDLPPELAGATQEQAAAAGWYFVVEPTELPEHDTLTQMVTEATFALDHETKTATPVHRVDAKYIGGGSFAGSCPVCLAEFIEAEDKADNVVKQALAKGNLRVADKI
jgi:hypothetical protein